MILNKVTWFLTTRSHGFSIAKSHNLQSHGGNIDSVVQLYSHALVVYLGLICSVVMVEERAVLFFTTLLQLKDRLASNTSTSTVTRCTDMNFGEYEKGEGKRRKKL